MRRSLFIVSLALVACGGGTLPARGLSHSQALTGSAEALEFESAGLRQELFREVARTSIGQAGHKAESPVLFPILRHGEFVAAPGFDVRTDLLQAPDAGAAFALTFQSQIDRWSEDRRDSFQGLSEREAVELIARSLLTHWHIETSGPIAVDRASGAPYAAAYMDGVLRVNPAFVYMAASLSGS